MVGRSIMISNFVTSLLLYVLLLVVVLVSCWLELVAYDLSPPILIIVGATVVVELVTLIIVVEEFLSMFSFGRLKVISIVV